MRRMASRTGIWLVLKKEIVKTVQARAGNYCETCGGVASDSMALHHRKLKSRGGIDAPSNLIQVHHECHNLGTQSIHANPSMATDKGWMVSSWADPKTEPMLTPDGSWVILKDDGSTEKV